MDITNEISQKTTLLDNSIKSIIKTTNGAQYEIDSVLLASSTKDIIVFKIKNTNKQPVSPAL